MGLVARLAGCRDPSRPYALDPGRAYPQEGTFATSSEKYGLLTVKGFPHKWGISDAFPVGGGAIPYKIFRSFLFASILLTFCMRLASLSLPVWFLFGSALVRLWFRFGYPLVSACYFPVT